jgi:6-pyruvoyltetrahydropterin/6-carboxytetrahydropterin synthase
MKTTVHRYYDFSYGHRILGEGKCSNLHGHNGRVTFHCVSYAPKDERGHLVPFEAIKVFSEWIEENWDHKMLLSVNDPLVKILLPHYSICVCPFNPSTENIATYILEVLGPRLLKGTPFVLDRVDFQETRKCGVTVCRT